MIEYSRERGRKSVIELVVFRYRRIRTRLCK